MAEHAEGIICLSGCLSSEVSVLLLNGQDRAGARRRRPSTATSSAPSTTSSRCRTTASPISTRSCAGSSSSARPRHPGRGHERPALHAEGGRQAPRRAALHPAAEGADRPEAPEVRLRGVLPQERRGDARTSSPSCPRPATARSTIAEACELDLVYGDRRPPTSATTCRGSRRRAASIATPTCAQLVERGRARSATARSRREVRERIDHELDVITSMGFAGYFLIVWDLIRYAREQGIRVGPGPRLGGRLGRVATACASPTSIRCATGCCSSGS